MKKQHFTIVSSKQVSQIVGGITDPNLDPDAGYVAPVKDPVPTDEPNDPVNEEPDSSAPRTRPTT